MTHFAEAPSPGLRPTSPPRERWQGGTISPQHHLSLGGEVGARSASGEGAFRLLEVIGKAH
jgi:hypothetical protein